MSKGKIAIGVVIVALLIAANAFVTHADKVLVTERIREELAYGLRPQLLAYLDEGGVDADNGDAMIIENDTHIIVISHKNFPEWGIPVILYNKESGSRERMLLSSW